MMSLSEYDEHQPRYQYYGQNTEGHSDLFCPEAEFLFGQTKNKGDSVGKADCHVPYPQAYQTIVG